MIFCLVREVPFSCGVVRKQFWRFLSLASCFLPISKVTIDLIQLFGHNCLLWPTAHSRFLSPSDSTERLANTVVINFSNSQIGEPNNVFAPSSPVVCTSPSLLPPPPQSRTVVTTSSCSLSNTTTTAATTPPPSTPSHPSVTPSEPQIRPKSSNIDLSDNAESKVRPVVETIAVHGRRLSYSRAAAADRLNSSDLDDLARQIGLLDSKQCDEPVSDMAKRSAAQATEPLNPAPAASIATAPAPEAAAAAAAAVKEGREGRSRKGKMGWLGGLFRRLRHWPDHSSSSTSSSPTAGEERKKHRRRARSLPPTSKRSATLSHASEPQSCESPSTGESSNDLLFCGIGKES